MRYFLSVLLFVAFPFVSSTPILGQIPTEGLVAFYPFNGNANDESGNGNNGMLLGGASVTSHLILGDNANDALSLPSTILNGLSDFTFAGDIQIQNVHSAGGYLVDANVWICGAASWHPGGNGFNLTYDGTIGHWRILVVPPVQTNYFFDYDLTIEDGAWHHIAITRSGDLATLYIDGAQLGYPTIVPDAPLECDEGGLIVGQEQDVVGGGFQQSQSLAGRIDNLAIYDRALSRDEIGQLGGSLTRGLVAHYPFNGNANDESGNGNDGTVLGATLCSDRFGNENAAYIFDGINDLINIGNNSSLEITGDMSMSVWIKMENLPSWFFPVVGKGENGETEETNVVYSLHVLSESGGAYPRHSHESGQGYNTDVISSRSIRAREWIHLGIVRNSTLKTYLFYINGVPEGDIPYSIQPNGGEGTDGYIGWAPWGVITYFAGIIDDIRIYNVAKTSNEIMALYLENNSTTTIAENEELIVPTDYALAQNFPNPFNPTTTITYSLPASGNVRVTVYSITGEKVADLVDQHQPSGTYRVEFNATQLGSGVYYYTLKAGQFLDTKRMVLLK
jgi:hypothetical protein